MSDVDSLADKVVSACKTYLNRGLGEMRNYLDDQLTSAKAHVKQVRDDLDARIDERSNTQGETMKSLERRASRQAEHLAKLEDRVRALEQSRK